MSFQQEMLFDDYAVDLLLEVKRPMVCCGYIHGGLDNASSIFPMGVAGLHGEWSSVAKAALSRNVRSLMERLARRRVLHRVFEYPPLFNKIRSFVMRYSHAYNLDSLCLQIRRQRGLVDDYAYLDCLLASSPMFIGTEMVENLNLRERFITAGWGGSHLFNEFVWYHCYLFKHVDLTVGPLNAYHTYQYLSYIRALRLQHYPSLAVLQRHGADVDAIEYGITETQEASEPVVVVDRTLRTFRQKWNVLTLLKLLGVLGQFGIADGAGDVGLLPRLGEVYMRWFRLFLLGLGEAALFVAEKVCSAAETVIETIDSLGTAVERLDIELVAIMVVVVLVMCLSAMPYIARALSNMLKRLFRWCCAPTLIPSSSLTGDMDKGFVESVTRNGDGSHLYNIRVGSKLYQVPDAPKDTTLVLEMAMPGSTLHESAFKPGVFAIVTYSEVGAIELVGMGCRVNDYLVTAAHVANTIFSGTRIPAIVPFKHGVKVILNSRKIRDLTIEEFDPDLGVDFGCLDVFAVLKDADFWNSAGITKVPVGKPSLYNQQISTVGLDNCVLVSAVGKTLGDSGRHILWHTASTNKGFSGGPVFCGSNMVGLHYAAQGDRNEAVRIESILHAMKYTHEYSSDLVISERGEVAWFHGKEGRIESEDGEHIFMGRDGQVVYLNEEYYQSKLHVYGDKDAMDDYDAGYSDDEMADIPTLEQDPYGDDPYYDDRGRRTTRNKELAKLKKKKPALNYEQAPPNVVLSLGLNPNIFEQVEDKAAVFTGAYPPVQPIALDMLESFNEQVAKQGFVPDAYGEPVITKKAEELSLVKHLAMYEDRLNSIVAPPTEKEIERVVALAEKFLEHNKYMPDPDYKSVEGIRRIIESTLVKGSKSAGHPYGADGMPLNSDVIRELGVDGLIDTVIREWDAPFDLKVFLKGEPHKMKKIDDCMLRIITALPLHKMVKHQTLFSAMTSAGVSNWRKSPVVFFSPQVPGDVENLWRRMSGRVLETDKSNWDFNMFGYVYDIFKRIILKLVIKHPDMSDDKFEEYLMDVVNAIDEVSVDSVYRCSNGHRYRVNESGIMKSGWVLTYFANSVSQLILHLLVSIRMDLTDAQILSPDMNIVCGGDDVLQAVPDDFDVDRCIFEYSRLGIRITGHKLHDTVNGAEFFSTEIWEFGGLVRYKPVRFTKHIYNLRTTKPEFLAAALVSHMMNYCWDLPRYKVFEDMFQWLLKYHPQLVDTSIYKSNSYWRYKSKGCECIF